MHRKRKPFCILSMEWSDLPYTGPEFDAKLDTVTRQSTINQFDLCGYRVKFKGEPDFLEPVSEPMVFGTCVHGLIAQDLFVGEVRLDMLSDMDEWVTEILETEYDWSLNQIPNVGDFFSEISAAYTQWRAVVYPNLPDGYPIIEEEMWMYLGKGEKGNIYLKGTPDAIYPSEIVDWKTAGRAWKEGKAWHSIQAPLYSALYKQNYGKSVRRFTFWIYNRKKRVWDKTSLTNPISVVNRALARALDLGRAEEGGYYNATPIIDVYGDKKRGWYCSTKFCGAWNICNSKFINDSVDTSLVAIRSWT